MELMRITIGKPSEVTNPDEDFRSVLFPFSLVSAELVGAPEELQATTNHRMLVRITNSRLAGWHLSEADLVKVLFQLGWPRFAETIRAGTLENAKEIWIDFATHPGPCPVDPSRIPEPAGLQFEIEEERRIGFK